MFKVEKIDDEEYFKIGDIHNSMLPALDSHKEWVLSASTLKEVYKHNLFFYLHKEKEEISHELRKIFRVGSAFHCYVLEHEEFYKRYYISDSVDEKEGLEKITKLDFEFIEATHKQVAMKYPNMIDNKYAEVAIFGEIDGVKVKCKIDKLNITKNEDESYTHVEIVDLKSVHYDFSKFKRDKNGKRWKLIKELNDLNYDLQAYFYTRLVKEWLLENDIYCSVSFSFILASKETYQVQKYIASDDMIQSGEDKFNLIWKEVYDFVEHGESVLNDSEYL